MLSYFKNHTMIGILAILALIAAALSRLQPYHFAYFGIPVHISSDSCASEESEQFHKHSSSYDQENVRKKNFYLAASSLTSVNIMDYVLNKDLPEPIYNTMLNIGMQKEQKKLELAEQGNLHDMPLNFADALDELYEANDDSNYFRFLANDDKKYYLLMQGQEADNVRKICENTFNGILSADDAYHNCADSQKMIFFTNDSSLAHDVPNLFRHDLDIKYIWILCASEKLADAPIIIDGVLYDACLLACPSGDNAPMSDKPQPLALGTASRKIASSYDYEGVWILSEYDGAWERRITIKALDDNTFAFSTVSNRYGGNPYIATMNHDGTAFYCFTSRDTLEKDNINFKLENDKLVMRFDGDVNNTTAYGLVAVNGIYSRIKNEEDAKRCTEYLSQKIAQKK